MCVSNYTSLKAHERGERERERGCTRNEKERASAYVHTVYVPYARLDDDLEGANAADADKRKSVAPL